MRAHGARTALNLIVNKDADSIIPPGKYSMIHEAVLNACDALDGVKDGVIENPTKCNFDYAKLACKAGDGAQCLKKGQVESAKAMTSPLKDPKTGKVLFEGHLMPGAELSWATLGGPEPLGPAATAMRNIVFKDRNWDYHTMNISTDIDRANKSDNGVMYSGDPNLKPFFDKGGKLVMYHGWSDPQVNPLNSTIYYNNVVNAVGKDKAAAEEYLRASDLDWTVVHPPSLTNGPATGEYRSGEALKLKGVPKISRADVAHFMLSELADGTYSRQMALVSA